MPDKSSFFERVIQDIVVVNFACDRITNHNGEHSSCRIHFQKFTHYQGPELLQSTNHQLSAQSDRRPVSVILKGKVYTIPLRSYCQRLSEGWSVSAMVYLLCITTLTQHFKSYEVTVFNEILHVWILPQNDLCLCKSREHEKHINGSGHWQ